MKVRVNLNVCSGHAHCEEKCPEVFGTDDTLGKCVILQEVVPPELEEKARNAVRNCPEGALSVSG